MLKKEQVDEGRQEMQKREKGYTRDECLGRRGWSVGEEGGDSGRKGVLVETWSFDREAVLSKRTPKRTPKKTAKRTS